eukprot:jgi/Ulvmu1/6667/UM003_0305.1
MRSRGNNDGGTEPAARDQLEAAASAKKGRPGGLGGVAKSSMAKPHRRPRPPNRRPFARAVAGTLRPRPGPDAGAACMHAGRVGNDQSPPILGLLGPHSLCASELPRAADTRPAAAAAADRPGGTVTPAFQVGTAAAAHEGRTTGHTSNISMAATAVAMHGPPSRCAAAATAEPAAATADAPPAGAAAGDDQPLQLVGALRTLVAEREHKLAHAGLGMRLVQALEVALEAGERLPRWLQALQATLPSASQCLPATQPALPQSPLLATDGAGGGGPAPDSPAVAAALGSPDRESPDQGQADEPPTDQTHAMHGQEQLPADQEQAPATEAGDQAREEGEAGAAAGTPQQPPAADGKRVPVVDARLAEVSGSRLEQLLMHGAAESPVPDLAPMHDAGGAGTSGGGGAEAPAARGQQSEEVDEAAEEEADEAAEEEADEAAEEEADGEEDAVPDDVESLDSGQSGDSGQGGNSGDESYRPHVKVPTGRASGRRTRRQAQLEDAVQTAAGSGNSTGGGCEGGQKRGKKRHKGKAVKAPKKRSAAADGVRPCKVARRNAGLANASADLANPSADAAAHTQQETTAAPWPHAQLGTCAAAGAGGPSGGVGTGGGKGAGARPDAAATQRSGSGSGGRAGAVGASRVVADVGVGGAGGGDDGDEGRRGWGGHSGDSGGGRGKRKEVEPEEEPEEAADAPAADAPDADAPAADAPDADAPHADAPDADAPAADAPDADAPAADAPDADAPAADVPAADASAGAQPAGSGGARPLTAAHVNYIGANCIGEMIADAIASVTGCGLDIELGGPGRDASGHGSAPTPEVEDTAKEGKTKAKKRKRKKGRKAAVSREDPATAGGTGTSGAAAAEEDAAAAAAGAGAAAAGGGDAAGPNAAATAAATGDAEAAAAADGACPAVSAAVGDAPADAAAAGFGEVAGDCAACGAVADAAAEVAEAAPAAAPAAQEQEQEEAAEGGWGDADEDAADEGGEDADAYARSRDELASHSSSSASRDRGSSSSSGSGRGSAGNSAGGGWRVLGDGSDVGTLGVRTDTGRSDDDTARGSNTSLPLPYGGGDRAEGESSGEADGKDGGVSQRAAAGVAAAELGVLRADALLRAFDAKDGDDLGDDTDSDDDGELHAAPGGEEAGDVCPAEMEQWTLQQRRMDATGFALKVGRCYRLQHAMKSARRRSGHTHEARLRVITVGHELLFVRWFTQVQVPLLLALEQDGVWQGEPVDDLLIDDAVDLGLRDWKGLWRRRRVRRAAARAAAARQAAANAANARLRRGNR